MRRPRFLAVLGAALAATFLFSRLRHSLLLLFFWTSTSDRVAYTSMTWSFDRQTAVGLEVDRGDPLAVRRGHVEGGWGSEGADIAEDVVV